MVLAERLTRHGACLNEPLWTPVHCSLTVDTYIMERHLCTTIDRNKKATRNSRAWLRVGEREGQQNSIVVTKYVCPTVEGSGQKPGTGSRANILTRATNKKKHVTDTLPEITTTALSNKALNLSAGAMAPCDKEPCRMAHVSDRTHHHTTERIRLHAGCRLQPQPKYGVILKALTVETYHILFKYRYSHVFAAVHKSILVLWLPIKV